jgi:hypothetical protein
MVWILTVSRTPGTRLNFDARESTPVTAPSETPKNSVKSLDLHYSSRTLVMEDVPPALPTSPIPLGSPFRVSVDLDDVQVNLLNSSKHVFRMLYEWITG